MQHLSTTDVTVSIEIVDLKSPLQPLLLVTRVSRDTQSSDDITKLDHTVPILIEGAKDKTRKRPWVTVAVPIGGWGAKERAI